MVFVCQFVRQSVCSFVSSISHANSLQRVLFTVCFNQSYIFACKRDYLLVNDTYVVLFLHLLILHTNCLMVCVSVQDALPSNITYVAIRLCWQHITLNVGSTSSSAVFYNPEIIGNIHLRNLNN